MSKTNTTREQRLSSLRPFARYRASVLLLAPVSILLCAAVGAWLGAVDGWKDVRQAWSAVNG